MEHLSKRPSSGSTQLFTKCVNNNSIITGKGDNYIVKAQKRNLKNKKNQFSSKLSLAKDLEYVLLQTEFFYELYFLWGINDVILENKI